MDLSNLVKLGSHEVGAVVRQNSNQKRRFRNRHRMRRRLFNAVEARLVWNEKESAVFVFSNHGLWMDFESFHAHFFGHEISKGRRLVFLKRSKGDVLSALKGVGFVHCPIASVFNGRGQVA